MVDLKEKENELKMLIKKIDSELLKFKKTASLLKSKKDSVEELIQDAGLEIVPVNLSASGRENLLEDIEKHILDLNKAKNFINAKLEEVMREEDLMEELENRFGDSVGIKKSGNGIEVNFSDKAVQDAGKEFEKSRKNLSEIRKQAQSL